MTDQKLVGLGDRMASGFAQRGIFIPITISDITEEERTRMHAKYREQKAHWDKLSNYHWNNVKERGGYPPSPQYDEKFNMMKKEYEEKWNEKWEKT